MWILAAVFLTGAVLGMAVYRPMRMTGIVSLALAILCAAFVPLSRWAERSRAGALCRRILLLCLVAGVLVFAATEVAIIARARKSTAAGPADAVIVLGAGVNGKKASAVLRSRIDKAAEYLKENPGVPAILSGGQGEGEDISEAQCMYDGLVKAGIAPGRLHLEDRSSTTRENLTNAKALLKELDIDPATSTEAVVTSDFHCLRAGAVAKDAGLNAETIPSQLDGDWWWLSANYYVREFFALGKMKVSQIF